MSFCVDSVGPMALSLRSSLLGLALVTAVPGLVDCAGRKLPTPAPVPTPGECPTEPGAIMAVSWGLDAELEARVKGGLAAAANLQKLALEVEGDVATACGGLARDLGASDAELQPKD